MSWVCMQKNIFNNCTWGKQESEDMVDVKYYEKMIGSGMVKEF